MYTRTEEVSWWSNTKSIGKIWIRPYLDIALSSSTLYCKKTSMSVDVWVVLLWGCLDNVKMVSEGVWGGFNAKSVHDTQILPFFQCQEFLSFEPSTECCCENPRKLWYDDHDWKSQMFGVMAQHVFHDDEEDRTAWGVVYELTQCFIWYIQCFYILLLETPRSLVRPSLFYPI